MSIEHRCLLWDFELKYHGGQVLISHIITCWVSGPFQIAKSVCGGKDSDHASPNQGCRAHLARPIMPRKKIQRKNQLPELIHDL